MIKAIIGHRKTSGKISQKEGKSLIVSGSLNMEIDWEIQNEK
ncbi:MAG: hypothetical protein NT045_00115 [Candidatus Aureabacteria bacterium]|nr:hypothetical protein [Candidatus Auribacterota bacterium]